MKTHKTYFIDIDGTIVKHLNNIQLDEILESEHKEELLPGVKTLWNTFHKNDKIIITTARKEKHRTFTELIFSKNELRYDALIMDLASGPRILINDTPSITYKKALAINVQRDKGFYFYDSCNETSDSDDY